MSEDLKLGDKVVLNSGGKNMTVTHISRESNPSQVVVDCTWFEGPIGDQKERHSSFPIEALKKIPHRAKKATIPPEIKKALGKIKRSLPSERQSGLDQLVSLNAADELAKLLGNKMTEVRQLAAIGLAELRYLPALPQLIDGLNVIEGKSVRDLIPNVENLLACFGEPALHQIIETVEKKRLPRLRKNRWVTAIANVISNEGQANRLLSNSLRGFLETIEKRKKETIPGIRLSWMSDDPRCTPFEVIFEAVIASDKSLNPTLLVEAATAYVTYSGKKIRRRSDFLKWLAKSNCKQSQQVIGMVGEWANNAVRLYEYELAEFGNSEDCVHDVIALLEAAVKLNAVSHDEIDGFAKDASNTDLIKELHNMKARRITD